MHVQVIFYKDFNCSTVDKYDFQIQKSVSYKAEHYRE